MNTFELIIVLSYILSAVFLTFVLLHSKMFIDNYELDSRMFVISFIPILNIAIIISAIITTYIETHRRS